LTGGGFYTEHTFEEGKLFPARCSTGNRLIVLARSLHNIRIEWLWRDIRKDTLEMFRRIFMHLESLGLLDMDDPIHRVCLFLVYRARIQKSLDETTVSWNNHKVRTAGNKTPIAMYQLSREHAINRGYWTGDPGDHVSDVTDNYGRESGDGIVPPAEELASDPTAPRSDKFPSPEAEHAAGIFVNNDNEIQEVRDILGDFDLSRDDENCGINVYCEAVLLVHAHIETLA